MDADRNAPSIEGLRLLNGHPIDQDSLFEYNNVVIFVILDGSPRVLEGLLNDLCRIVDRYQYAGVVALVAFEHYNPIILRTAAGSHSFKRLLISFDEGETGRISQRYRNAFKESNHYEATAFIIDKGGKVQWHGSLKDKAFDKILEQVAPGNQHLFDTGLDISCSNSPNSSPSTTGQQQ